MTFDELTNYFNEHNFPSYKRDNYDKYLENVVFSFNVPSIHITGTNGKGSTANYIYQIYLKEGYKVGLYNSPFMNTVNEMISINGVVASKEEYLNTFLDLKNSFEEFNLSSFEMQTVIAFEMFKKANLDLVIIEVGMGGFIDATNIIKPTLAIITSVSLEHTNYLGYSTSEIAYNKAGIIKNECKVLLGELDPDAQYAVRERCKKTKSEIRAIPAYFNEKVVNSHVIFDCVKLNNVELNTPCLYQAKNANLAIEAVNLLMDKFPVKEVSIRDGLLLKTLDCRFDWLNDRLLIDGAHNPEAMRSLVDSIKMVVDKPVHVVFACFKDKNFSAMLNLLDEVSDDVTITSFEHIRAKTKEEYLLFLSTYNFADDYKQKIKELLENYPDDIVLVTGSLYFAALAKRELKDEI